MWRLINEKLNVWTLWLIRTLNLVVFLAIVFYVGQWITGLDLTKIVYLFSILWGILRGYDKDLISVVAKKIVTLEWGLSFLIFIFFLMFLWNFRWGYIKNFKELCRKIV